MSASTPENTDEASFLKQLATALVDHPRSNLQELAKAVGVSKATLYRFSPTREELIARLSVHCMSVIGHAVAAARLEAAPTHEALRTLIVRSLEHRELTAFVTHYWKDAPGLDEFARTRWKGPLDAFFLRGQEQGFFRIDLPAPALTEMLVWMLSGLVDAERRGRVARESLATVVESVFLCGVQSPRSNAPPARSVSA